METTIKSDRLAITASDNGGELRSIINLSTGKEILWNGDPRWWNRRAPVLFPIVGKLDEGYYMYGGKRYELAQHGFARDMLYTLAESSESLLVYELRESRETLIRYPFQFSLLSSYALRGNKITIARKVENRGKGDMPFCIGEHPGFMLPDDGICYFEFERTERLSNRSEVGSGVSFEGKLLPYTSDMFADGAYLFNPVNSNSVLLRDDKGDFRVRVGFEGFPYLAFWNKPYAPFVCVEPWMALGSSEPSIEARPGCRVLRPGEYFSCQYTITVE